MATLLGCSGFTPGAGAQDFSKTVIWSETGVPAADTVPASADFLRRSFPKARLASAEQLSEQLHDSQTELLVLPQGSVFPESAWPAIHEYLRRGGNLLVLGGRPFSRAAYRDAQGWHLRDYSVRFMKALLIDEYQETPGSEGEEFALNPDIPIELPRFGWERAFSPTMRLSANNIGVRGGSAGYLDVRMDPLAWGKLDGRKSSAPVLEMDHLSSGFDGGRWIFLSAELAASFYSSPEATTLVRTLAKLASEGSSAFSVRPVMPLYLPGEPVELEITFHPRGQDEPKLSLEIDYYAQGQAAKKQTFHFVLKCYEPLRLPPPTEKGLQVIDARLMEGTNVRGIYHSGFWVRDEEFLRSGPRLGVNADYFTLDEKPFGVVGTTYMSSEVQRLYFDHPNVYVWDRDFAQMQEAGINMVRSGWWTGWEKLCDETGRPYERTLRTLEAYLMTARKYGMPVQFNFFAFLPEILGGANAYLDPQAVRREKNLVTRVTGRFHEVQYVAWDLINEPSFSGHLWTMRPNGDWAEQKAWNTWLNKRYPDRLALAAAWNVLPESVQGTIAVPSEQEFAERGIYGGASSLRVYDFNVFAQESFAEWVHGMREAIRRSGSQQPITVGQDEGGNTDRLSPAYFAPEVDFTTNHSWWMNDDLLWDSLVAKQPGKAMLIQETGLQRELTMEERARLTPEEESRLFERKMALSFVGGAGAIEWLWNSNGYMSDSNETPIGALREDGTERPEGEVLRGMAKFAKAAAPYLQKPKQAEIAVVTSQAAQFSVLAGFQLEAQRNAVRILGYELHQPCYLIAENQIGKLGHPKAVILPSAQALREETWQALLEYVKAGGQLLVTGPISRNEHWHLQDRLSAIGVKASVEPLTMHTAGLSDSKVVINFRQQSQSWLEFLKFPDDSQEKEVSLGKGKVRFYAYPVELAESNDAAREVYGRFLRELQLAWSFSEKRNLPAGVLAYAAELDEGVLYIFESERNEDTEIDLQDSTSGVDLKFQLKSEHAALVVVEKRSKQIVAKYGF